MAERERYLIELEALADDVPAIHRLRAALKVLLRRFGLRCVRSVELPGEIPTAAREEVQLEVHAEEPRPPGGGDGAGGSAERPPGGRDEGAVHG